MTPRWRQLKTMAEIEQAAFDVQLWGYPRPLAPNELELSAWYRFGEGLVVFFNAVDREMPLEVTSHICRNPEDATAVFHAERVVEGIYLIAELLGFYRIRNHEPAGGRNLLRRLGWTEDGEWWYKDLPGARDVDWDATRVRAKQYIRERSLTRLVVGG